MESRKYIAFIDVLGFKDLVLNNSHDRLADLYEKIFSSTVAVGLAKGNMNFFEKDGKSYWEPRSWIS